MVTLDQLLDDYKVDVSVEVIRKVSGDVDGVVSAGVRLFEDDICWATEWGVYDSMVSEMAAARDAA